MTPLTEQELRLALKDKTLTHFTVPKGTVVTPSAMEYLKMCRIELVEGEAPAPKVHSSANPGERPAPKWDFSAPKSNAGEAPKLLFFGPDGGQFDHKPEAFTHLKGRQLVYKDHPIIIWRGKLDTLTAKMVEAQIIGAKEDNQEFIADLQEVLEFTRRLLSYEIRGKEVEEFNLLGWSAADLRARSHDPVKYFGFKHMLTDYRMGPLCVALNSLRAEVRETELAAASAFKDANGQATRDDIIRALNRLSSLFYLMMFKYLPKDFKPEHSGI